MPKFIAQFETTICGELTIDAPTEEAAQQMADNLAEGTLNYDDLTDGGQYAPDVETECFNVCLKRESQGEGDES